MNTSSHRSDLQALRGVAVLLVVLYHAEVGFTGGFVGVDAFFVVSGFVIARGLLREVDRTGTVDLRQFYVRRVRRLLPALATLIVPVLAVSVVLLPLEMQDRVGGTALSASLFLSNVYLYVEGGNYFAPNAGLNPFLHMWSLSVEEQFYLVLPAGVLVLAWIARRARLTHPRRLMIGTFAAVAVVSFLMSWQMSSGRGFLADQVDTPRRFAFYAPVTRVWEFLAGVLLALVIADRVIARRPQIALRLGGLAVLVASAWTFDAATPFPGAAAALPVFATAAVIAAGPTVPRRPSPEAAARPATTAATLRARSTATAAVVVGRTNRVMQTIGDHSYSWYLWHWPAIVFAGVLWPGNSWVLPVAAVVSLVPAVASTHLVENPVRFRPVALRRPTALVAAVCIAVPALAGFAAPRIVDAVVDVDPPAGWSADRRALVNDCFPIAEPFSDVWDPDLCTVRHGDGDRLVMVLGDSHAASASFGVDIAAARLGADLALWARSGCPLLVDRWVAASTGCRTWQVAARQTIALHRPDVVVVVNRSWAYTDAQRQNVQWMITDGSDMTGASVDEVRQLWEEGFTALLDELTAQGIPVVVMSNAPDFLGRWRSFGQTLLDPEPKQPVDTLANIDARRGPVVELERRVAARYPTVRVVDAATVLCPDGICRAGFGEHWWFRDDNHLNDAGSRLLADMFTEAIGDLLGDAPDDTLDATP